MFGTDISESEIQPYIQFYLFQLIFLNEFYFNDVYDEVNESVYT